MNQKYMQNMLFNSSVFLLFFDCWDIITALECWTHLFFLKYIIGYPYSVYIYICTNKYTVHKPSFSTPFPNNQQENKFTKCDAGTLPQSTSSRIQVFGSLILTGSQPTVLSWKCLSDEWTYKHFCHHYTSVYLYKPHLWSKCINNLRSQPCSITRVRRVDLFVFSSLGSASSNGKIIIKPSPT